MKNIPIVLLLMSILFCVSCQKEQIIEEVPEVVIEEPIEIEYPVVKGVLQNDNEFIVGADIKVYQNETLVGTVQTDENGVFNTAELQLSETGFVTFEIKKDSYHDAYRRRTIEQLESEVLNIHLLSDEYPDLNSEIIANPGSNELISVSGYVKNSQGGPSEAFVTLAYDIMEFNNGSSFGFSGGATYVDPSGYYEFLLPMDQEFHYVVIDGICGVKLNEYDVLAFYDWETELIGPFTTDQVLEDIINPIDQKPSLSITGVVFECDGDVADFAEVTFETEEYTSKQWISSGESYTFEDESCLQIPYDIKVSSYDADNNRYSDTIVITVTEYDAMINQDLTACESIDEGYSELNINIDNGDYAFNQVLVRNENGDLISDELAGLNIATFKIPNATIGLNQIEELTMLSWSDGLSIIAVEGTVVVDIISLTNNSATAEFSGDFTITDGSIHAATGTMNLVF